MKRPVAKFCRLSFGCHFLCILAGSTDETVLLVAARLLLVVGKFGDGLALWVGSLGWLFGLIWLLKVLREKSLLRVDCAAKSGI